MDPSQERLSQIDAHFRAANYIGAAQLYLRDNALLRESLKPARFWTTQVAHEAWQTAVDELGLAPPGATERQP